MSQQLEKLIKLLKELFQLDQPDLDFGIYRILHARSAEITQFLERDLPPQVREAFAQYASADRAALEKELEEAINQALAVGVDPESAPKVRELRARLKEEAVDTGALEAEVYDHLYTFFRRYYDEGDFISRRVYKEGVYAIPYEGEEVKLYWANHDQYYIKTSEYLRDYAFRLRPEDKKNPMRVRFQLVDATEGEHGNVKESNKRVFVLAGENLIGEEEGELVIRFEFRPATMEDWPEEEREGKKKPPKQKDLNAIAEATILGLEDPALAGWLELLRKNYVRADGTISDNTTLRVHLERYTARNTFDYFIHKDLGGFLRRELDFYIKNEVMHLDDIESEAAPRVEQYLSKIKVIRKIAHKIIDFLAQLEDFQKKLWLKKKFVVETEYCITLDRIFAIENEKTRNWLIAEIIRNSAQRKEWGNLFAIHKVKGDLTTPGYSEPLTVEFLLANPALVVDTRHFGESFKEVLLESIHEPDEKIDGLLIHSENFQALNLIISRYYEEISCTYIDPPFNTGDDFFFKDSYRFSSWMCLLYDRLKLSREMLRCQGSMFLHLDHNANFLGRQLLNYVFGESNFVNEIIWRIGWVSGYKTQVDAFVRNHDTIFYYAKIRSELYFRKKDARIPYHSFTRDSVKNEIRGIMEAWKIDPQTVSTTKISFKYPDGYVCKLGLTEKEGQYNIEDTWNCSEYEELHSNKIKRNAAEYTPNGSVLTQKPEELLKRIIELTTDEKDIVMDFFAGSGTTPVVAWKLGRKFIAIEVERYFDDDLLWRLKKAFNGHTVGISRVLGKKSGGFLKVIRLESYEDTLNNLELKCTKEQEDLLNLPEAQGPDGLREQYMLRYMLDVETRGSQSLLNVSAFTDPTAYTLKVKRPGSDESREVCVDLIETFNWLIGLTVQHIAAPQTFAAEFERDDEGRLRLKGRLKSDPEDRWWFRTISGVTRDGRKTLVIWRKRPGGETPEGMEQDNLVLDEWFRKQGYSSKDSEFDLIYVNGDNNLENLKAPDDTWKVRLIEEDFLRLMFAAEDA